MSLPTPSPTKQLYNMTWPMVIGLFAIMSTQLIDSAFIGQLGSKPLAAVSFSIPIFQLIIGVQVGLGIATTTVISIALGRKENQRATELGSLVILFGIFMMCALCLLLYKFEEFIMIHMGAGTELLPVIKTYWLPWLISCFCGAMLYFGCSIFRARGETYLPGMIMVLSSIINIILDPTFIFIFEMNIAGAAWASAVSFIIGCIVIYRKLFFNQYFTKLPSLKVAISGVKYIVSYMTPSMLSQFMPSISAIVATTIVASFGEIVIAAWGLGTRIEYFSIIIILALTMALPPMIGKLKGEQNLEAINRLFKISVKFIVLLQTAIAILSLIFSTPIGSALSVNNDVREVLFLYLIIVPISYIGLGICMVCVSICSAMDAPKLALFISVSRLGVCYIPLLWIGSQVAGFNGLLYGAASGNFCAGLIGWLIYRKHLITLKQNTSKQIT